MGEIKIFEGQGIRSQWDAEKEDWFFSVSDVAFVLAESTAKDTKRGGGVAKNTRIDIENQLGQSVISALNARTKNLLEVKPKTKKGEA